jgi:[protein-PII] uridylyltransferase
MARSDSIDQETVQALLAAARRELSEETGRGAGGRMAVERYAGRIDALLQMLFGAAPTAARAVAVVALGGYGRRHLSPFSDVDVLILFDGAISADDERLLRGILHPLWDLGLTVGHQVRELGDFGQIETDNPEFFLALADARFVAGDRALFDRFTAIFWRWETQAFLFESLRRLIDERHAQFNDTFYQLEPDVKDAPGALRDLTAIRTISRITDPGMLALAPAERARLDEAEEFLLRIRSILHVQRQRNHNVLSHELQEKAAQLLGYPGVQAHHRVERLMAEYFRHARAVSRALEWTRKTAPTPAGANLARSRDGIGFIDAQQAGGHPEQWLDIFRIAIDTGVPVSTDALACIQQHVIRHAAEDFFSTEAARDALLALLKPRAGLYARLSEMHDCGLLGRMFPEFQAISCRVIRDFYHKYTVDEHTLLTIRNLERVAASAVPSRGRFSGLLADLESPELLVLALLFHDVGKWRDDDHTVESVRMAQQMLERLRMPAESREVVEFLIRNHLRMSIAAFRRDTEDPEIVQQLAELVGSEERLKMLCLLTLVDIEAVSLDTLTPWREELLWQLYVDTYNQLTLGYGDELIERNQSGLSDLLAVRPDDLEETDVRRFLEGLPRRYLSLFRPAAIFGHVRLSHDIHPDEVHVSLEQKGAMWELTVVTLDKPFLFSNICGVLSSFGMDIQRGQALTNPNGLVLDIVQFVDQERFLELNPDANAQIVHELAEAVSGRRDVSVRLRARENGVLHSRGARRITPTIHADHRTSRRYTIVEIVAGNRLGLLHRISRMISRHRCDVHLVLIATQGETAIDVFHITRDGAKLPEAAESALTADLHHMLEESDEVD